MKTPASFPVSDVVLSRTDSERAILQALRTAASNGFHYERRPYQITVAHRAAKALSQGRHVILTLPTGTGKTLIAGMVASLHLHTNPEDIVLVTAPRLVLLSQLATRTRWLSGTFPATALGIPPITRNADVVPVVAHA
jgi:superfamily II DNA or RNA helicase